MQGKPPNTDDGDGQATSGQTTSVPAGDDGARHPPVGAITDLLTFRLFRLVALVERAGTRWGERPEFNFSINEWRVLALAQAMGPVRTGHVAWTLVMDKGQLSRVVKSLIDKGYLSSRPDADDARATLLETTDAGRAMHAKALDFLAARNEQIVEPLSREECSVLAELLTRLLDHNLERLYSGDRPTRS